MEFALRGFAGANLSDIQERSGVSVGSFYHQFKDKADLLLAVLAEFSVAMQRMLREIRALGREVKLSEIARRSLRAVFDFADESPDLFRIFLRERAGTDPDIGRFLRQEYDRFVRELTAAFDRVARAGGYPTVDLALGAEIVAGMILAAVSRYLEETAEGGRPERARLEEGLVRMTLGGLLGLRVEQTLQPEARPASVRGKRRKAS
ncbi:MAG: TetR family transcriptional regulator [Candidatus Methylomirabilis sp.]|nr:TetR family transcriptional regulator [Deltaproteobacteria bacterium]